MTSSSTHTDTSPGQEDGATSSPATVADVGGATGRPATVADVVGATVANQGVTDAFGILGSGNLIVTNALVRGGVRFHHARHEGGATCMADGFGRVTGRVSSGHRSPGPGLTNTLTGLAEAAKSRTPLLVLAGETPAAALTSNFRIDQHDLVESVGAIADRVHSPKTAADDARRAYERAVTERRPVVLMLPIDIQLQPAASAEPLRPPPGARPTEPKRGGDRGGRRAHRGGGAPAIIAGRGAVLANAGRDRVAGPDDRRDPRHQRAGEWPVRRSPLCDWDLGGFASPFAAELLPQADLYLAVGASLNNWTTKHGGLINPEAKLIQIDVEAKAIGLTSRRTSRSSATRRAQRSRSRER